LLIKHFVPKTSGKGFLPRWDIMELVEKLTGVSVEVKDSSGNWCSWVKWDIRAQLNYIAYWHHHYMDYRWDKNNKGFINKTARLLPVNRCDMLFRLVRDEESPGAAEAFLELLETDPAEVSIKLDQYDYRRSPGFWPGYMEQLARYTGFCRRHSISYNMSPQLKKKIEKLKALPYGIEKYRMENQLVKELTLKDIPALEFFVLSLDQYEFKLSDRIKDVERSIWRILNIMYSDHWQEITRSPLQLRFYLKKSYLFSHIGIVGIHNNYLYKFRDMSVQTRERVEALLKTEKDSHIKEEALNVITGNLAKHSAFNKKGKQAKKISLDEFLKNAASISKRLTGSVEFEKSNNNLARIVDLLLREKDPEIASKYISLLGHHTDLAMVPQLFRIIELKTVLGTGYMNRHDRQMRDHTTIYEITMSDRVVDILERLYNHSFPPPPEPGPQREYISGTWNSSVYLKNKNHTVKQWLEMWHKDGKNFLNWGQELYAQKLRLLEQPKVDISLINHLFASRFYKSEHRRILFEALAKVSPPEAVNGFDIRKKTTTTAELKYFEGLPVHPGKVRKLLLHYCHDMDGQIAFDFIKKVSRGYSVEEKGVMYVEFVFSKEFRKWLREVNPCQDIKNDIIRGLIEMKKNPNNDYIMEKIETLISYVRRYRQPLEQQLRQILEKEGKGLDENLRQVLTDATFKDLGIILNHYPRLPLSNYAKVEYIADMLGISVPGLTEENVNLKALEMVKHLARLPEPQFYKYYLDQWGLDYTRADGDFDFRKIYRILKFDSTRDYPRGLGQDRHVRSLIRLLEFRFKTLLGCEERFSGSINGFLYDFHGRAQAWMKYLKDKGLVKSNPDEAPSF
jgi:hypothetical protein